MNNENADRTISLLEGHGVIITQNRLLLESLIYQALNEAEARGRAAGLEEAAKLVESWAPPHGSDGKYEHMAKRIRDRNGVDANRHIPLGSTSG